MEKQLLSLGMLSNHYMYSVKNESQGNREVDMKASEKGLFFFISVFCCFICFSGTVYADGTEQTIGEPVIPVIREEEDGNYYYTLNDVIDTDKSGLVCLDGVWYYLESGRWITDKYAFVEYDGSRFLVANGVVAANKSGLTQDPEYPENWFFCVNGQIFTKKTGIIYYNGSAFYVENGVLNQNVNGFFQYDTGLFFVNRGRVVKTANGLVQDPNNGEDWYFVANGQVQKKKTGPVYYNNAVFYVKEGKLDQSNDDLSECFGIIRFHSNIPGNDITVERQYRLDQNITTLYIPNNWKNKDYVLAGWSKDCNGTDPEYYIASDFIPNSFFYYTNERDLYAVWVPANETYGNVLFIGDSYISSSKWHRKTAALLDLGRSFTVVNYPGTGFVNRVRGYGELGGENKINFTDLLIYSDNMISNNNQIKIIVIMAGYNDYFYEKDEVKQAVISFAENMHQRYPNATLYLGMAGTNFKDENIENRLLNIIAPAYKEAADVLPYVQYVPYDEKNSISGYLRWFGDFNDDTGSNGIERNRDSYSGYYYLEETSAGINAIHPTEKTGEIIAGIAANYIINHH